MLADYVWAGATFLDGRIPDWYERITVSDLIMSDCLNCVLGQLFKTYNQGIIQCTGINVHQANMEEMDNAHVWAIEHGFTIDYSQGNEREWRDLWVEQIRQRRGF